MSLKKLSPVAWDKAESALSLSLGDYLSTAKQQVEQGNEYTFLMGDAFLLLRAERHAEETELVIVGYTGKHTLAENAPLLYEFARSIGCQSVRLHTKRIAELRFLNSLGLDFHLAEQRSDEYVLRTFLGGTHGR